MAAFAFVALVLLALWPEAAAAHQVNLSTARITVRANGIVDVDIAMKGSDVDRVAGTSVYDTQTGLVRPDALTAASARVAGYIAAHSAVLDSDGGHCNASDSTVAPDADGVAVHTAWSCGQDSGPLRYRSTVPVDVAPDARQVVLVQDGSRSFQDLLDASRTESVLSEAAPPSTFQVVRLYLAAGVEHILIGYDHIAFLIAIVLWARRIWPVVKLVTAFTIGHSITLSLAALDIVRIPSSIIEPAIAASIVFVATENFFHTTSRSAGGTRLALAWCMGSALPARCRSSGFRRAPLCPPWHRSTWASRSARLPL